MSSQSTTQSYGSSSSRRSRTRRSRSRSYSRSPSPSPMRWTVPTRPRLRRSSVVTKNTVHSFTRMTSTNYRNNLDGTTNNWALSNDGLGGFVYSPTNNPGSSQQTPYLHIWFDLLSAHFDTHSNAGALVNQVPYGLPSVAEFVALYQEFRIDWIQIDIFTGSVIANNQAGGGGGYQVPFINYVKDYNDTDYTPLTTMQQDNSCQLWQPGTNTPEGNKHTIRIRPKAQFTVASADGGVGGTAEIPGLQWLSTDSCQTVPHYGIKMAVNNFFPETSPGKIVSNLGFNITYHLSFRNTK